MKLVINELHAQLFAQALLEPGEQLAGKVMAKEEPWYTRFLRFDFFMPYTLFLATDRRLIMLEHKRRVFSSGYELASVESVPWSDVEELAAKGMFTKNKLRVRARTRLGAPLKNVTLKVPMWAAPLRNNGRELKNVVGTFQALRSVAPPAMGTGPATPYMQPGYGYAPALNAPASQVAQVSPSSYPQQPYQAQAPQQQQQQPPPRPGYAAPGYGPRHNGQS